MLGYVRAYKPDLTFSQYDIYKGVYCSLCKVIGKNYGFLSRMTLSYDLVFFALVRMSVNEQCNEFKKSHCSFNPCKKCLQIDLTNDDLEYTADVSMLMVYYKFVDNLQDSKGMKKFFLHFMTPFFNSIKKKAIKRNPEINEILSQMSLKQVDIETNFDGNIDRACHPSAEALGKLLEYKKSDDQKEFLYKFGYLVGRWVYLIDAIDDYNNDKRNSNFNPFLFSGEYNSKTACEKLNYTASECVEAFNRISVNRYEKIIYNILYDGLYSSMKSVIERNNYEKSV